MVVARLPEIPAGPSGPAEEESFSFLVAKLAVFKNLLFKKYIGFHESKFFGNMFAAQIGTYCQQGQKPMLLQIIYTKWCT